MLLNHYQILCTKQCYSSTKEFVQMMNLQRTYNNFFTKHFVPESQYCKECWYFSGLRPTYYQHIQHKYILTTYIVVSLHYT